MRIILFEICGGALLAGLACFFLWKFPSFLKLLGPPKIVVDFFEHPPMWFPVFTVGSLVVGVMGTVSVWTGLGAVLILAAANAKLARAWDISSEKRIALGITGVIFTGFGIFTLIKWWAILVVMIGIGAGLGYKLYRRSNRMEGLVPEGDGKESGTR